MNDIKWIILIVILIIVTVAIYMAYRLNNELNKPVPPDGRCRNCKTTVRDEWHDIRCTNKKSIMYRCMVDDFNWCQLWKRFYKSKVKNLTSA